MLRLTMLGLMGTIVGVTTGVACGHPALWTAVGAALGPAWWKLTNRLPAS